MYGENHNINYLTRNNMLQLDIQTIQIIKIMKRQIWGNHRLQFKGIILQKRKKNRKFLSDDRYFKKSSQKFPEEGGIRRTIQTFNMKF